MVTMAVIGTQGLMCACLKEFGAWELSSLLWSFAKMTYTDRCIVVPLLRRVGRQSRSLQPLGVSNAAWAIVSMEWHVRGGTYKAARSVLRRLSIAAFASASKMSAQVRASSPLCLLYLL